MVAKFGVEALAADLRKIGVSQGDTVYVRSRVSAVGRLQQRDSLLMALLDAVGPTGTLVLPAFTNPGYRWSKTIREFMPNSPSDSGALSNQALGHAAAVRSTHPTHSFVAIGPAAPDILYGHDHSAPAFYPVEKMITNRAKMLLIGCGKESPGFSTVHHAQEQLGLTKRHLTKYFYRMRIRRGDSLVDWYPEEDPGCSRGFDKLYLSYIREEFLGAGWVGQAYSLIAPADRLYEVDRQSLENNPLVVLCDRRDCVSCRILRSYNISAAPVALACWLTSKIRNRLFS